MCEELSACAVMTDGAGSLFRREVIKSQIMSTGEGQGSAGGAKTEKGEADQIRQMIRAISQCGNVLRGGKCYFLPVWFGVRGRREVKSMTPRPRASEELLIRVLHGLPMLLSAEHDWFPIAVICRPTALKMK